LSEVKDLAKKNNSILIFDETITGYRYSIGGAQLEFNVTPDLTTLGKGIANGYPLSAIVGKREIMKEIENIFFSGTFGGELLSLAAAKTVIQMHLNFDITGRITSVGSKIALELQKIINSYKMEEFLHISGHPTWKFLNWEGNEKFNTQVIKTYFMQEMFKKGVLVLSTHNNSLSLTEKISEQVINVYGEVISDLSKSITDTSLLSKLQVKPIQPLFTLRWILFVKKILVLGGGEFLGYWIAKVLELNSYEITFFNTGKNTPKLFSNFYTKVGDRRDYKNKTFFSGSSFDVIIDTSAYSPLDLALTKYLEHSQYIFISSVAVYCKSIPLYSNENAKKIIDKVKFTEDRSYTYGELKFLTEVELQMISKNCTILRPAIILGDRDNTGRLSMYTKQSKDYISLPNLTNMPFQYIDVIDVANFVRTVLEKKLFGAFNVTNKSISRDEFFLILASIQKKRLTYNDFFDPRLYPLHESIENSSLRTLSSDLALKNGLEFTPVEQTLSKYWLSTLMFIDTIVLRRKIGN